MEIVKADDELNPSVVVQRFNKLANSYHVDIIAGVIGSNVAIALSELEDRAKAHRVLGRIC